MSPRQPRPAGELEILTRRQREVMDRLATGDHPKGIAAVLGISVSAVKFHIEEAQHRLGAATREEACFRWGLRQNLSIGQGDGDAAA